MAKNISIAGTNYNAVPSIQTPLQGGGTADFFDVSGTTATASDVATGKLFYAADGTLTTGTSSGGSTTLTFGAIRPDAELLQTYSYDKYIVSDEEKTLPSYSTTAQTLLASSNLSPTITIDTSSYNYLTTIRGIAIPTYNRTTLGTGRQEYSLAFGMWEHVQTPANTFHAIVDTNKKYTSTDNYMATETVTRMGYFSSASSFKIQQAQYGAYLAFTAPSVSSTTLTIKSPALNMRGSSTYFSSTYWGYVTDVRYQWIINVWRAPKGNLNLDGWFGWQFQTHILDNLYSNTHTLT